VCVRVHLMCLCMCAFMCVYACLCTYACVCVSVCMCVYEAKCTARVQEVDCKGSEDCVHELVYRSEIIGGHVCSRVHLFALCCCLHEW